MDALTQIPMKDAASCDKPWELLSKFVRGFRMGNPMSNVVLPEREANWGTNILVPENINQIEIPVVAS